MVADCRDVNHKSAYAHAMAFVKNPTMGGEQIRAVEDNATAEAYENTLRVIDSIINPLEENANG